MANQTWVYENFINAADAVTFLNTAFRQGPGEASVFVRDNGSVSLFYLEPGSLGTSTAPTWQFLNLASPAAVVAFLNEAFRQGPGEASVSPELGPVGLFYLEPGSLGTSTAPTWQFENFPNPSAAIAFLNDPARQGSGQVSAVATSSNGSVTLYYLEPGSLGSSTQQTWFYENFPNPAAAVAFLNEAPRQGPGEASAFARDDGTVSLFYLEPGTG